MEALVPATLQNSHNEDRLRSVQLCTPESRDTVAALYCDTGVIHIHEVMYSVSNRTTCHFLRTDDCVRKIAAEDIVQQCELRKECHAPVTSVWLNQCGSQSTHTLLLYRCLTGPERQMQCVCGNNCTRLNNNEPSNADEEAEYNPHNGDNQGGNLDQDHYEYYASDYPHDYYPDNYNYYGDYGYQDYNPDTDYNSEHGPAPRSNNPDQRSDDDQKPKEGTDDDDDDDDDESDDDDTEESDNEDDGDDVDDDDGDDQDKLDHNHTKRPQDNQRRRPSTTPRHQNPSRTPRQRSPSRAPRQPSPSRTPRHSSRSSSPRHRDPSRRRRSANPDQSHYGGFITSPHFPNGYPHGSNCMCILHAEKKSSIVLEALYFQLEDGYDFLSIQGNGLVQPFTGEELHRKALFTNVLIIHFESDYSTDDMGFLLHYKAVDHEQNPVQILAFCGTDISELRRKSQAADFGTGTAGPSISPFTVGLLPRTGPTKIPKESSTKSRESKAVNNPSITKYIAIGSRAVIVVGVIIVVVVCCSKRKGNPESNTPVMSLSELHQQKSMQVMETPKQKGEVYETLQPIEGPLQPYENLAFQKYPSQNHNYTGLTAIPTAPISPPGTNNTWRSQMNAPNYPTAPAYSGLVYDGAPSENSYLSLAYGYNPPAYMEPMPGPPVQDR